MGLSLLQATSVIVATVTLLCYLLSGFLRSVYLASKIPGPSLWELLTIHLKKLVTGDLIVHTWKMCESYGYKPWGLWFYQNYTTFISDPVTLSEVYRTKNLEGKPPQLYQEIAKEMGNGLLTLSGSEYRRHRKLMHPVFRKVLIESQQTRVNEDAAELVQKLLETLEENVDVRHIIEDRTLSATVSIFTSGSYRYPNIRELSEFLKDRSFTVHFKTTNPIYYWCYFRWLKSTRQNEAKGAQLHKSLKELFMSETSIMFKNRAKNEDSKPVDLIDFGLRAVCDMGENGLTLDECYDEMKTLFSAGAETTGFTVNVALIMLALHPEIQQKVFDEIQSTFQGSDRLVETEDLSRMVYLNMFAKETLRLFPPVPMILKSVAEETTLNNVVVPKGSLVGINFLALHRNPNSFKDPLKFDPDRFLPENLEGVHPMSFIPFSTAYRACPGQLQAYMVIKTFLCQILRNFHVLPGNKVKSVNDIKLVMYFALTLGESYPLRFVRREKC